MGRPLLPPEVTPQQLDAIFRYLIELKPERERAVRLRLTGLTLQEVADTINADKAISADKASGTKAYAVWVGRACETATKKLALYYERSISNRLVRLHEKAWLDPAFDGQTIRMKPTIDAMLNALSQSQHKERGVKPGNSSHKAQKEYPCPKCKTTEWTFGTKNAGGHNNMRWYVCVNCSHELPAAERTKLWRYVS